MRFNAILLGPTLLCLTLLQGITLSAASAAPFSDPFSGNSLNPGWSISSPNPDSSVGLTGKGYLLMTASPKNGGSDLYAGTNFNAPVILQPISSSLDWTVTVQVNYQATNDAQGAGIMVATQNGGFTEASQFLRLAEHDYVSSEAVCGLGVPNNGATCAGYSGSTIYLRVIKSGSNYTVEYSANKKQWTKLAEQKITTSYSYIGLFSIRQPWDDNDSVYTNAYFNYFNIKVKNQKDGLRFGGLR